MMIESKDRVRRMEVLESMDYQMIFGKFKLWKSRGGHRQNPKKLGGFGGFRKTPGSGHPWIPALVSRLFRGFATTSL